jgi:hypothetical protein
MAADHDDASIQGDVRTERYGEQSGHEGGSPSEAVAEVE